MPEEQVRFDRSPDLYRKTGYGFEHSAGLRIDGTLVVCGNCYHGQRGLESEADAV